LRRNNDPFAEQAYVIYDWATVQAETDLGGDGDVMPNVMLASAMARKR